MLCLRCATKGNYGRAHLEDRQAEIMPIHKRIAFPALRWAVAGALLGIA
jgi:hypothetical protein